MSFVQSHPVESYVHSEDVRSSKLIVGAKVFIKNKDLPANPRWTHLVVYEYLGPAARKHHVLGVVRLERERNRTKVITKEEAVLQNVRTMLIHVPPRPDGFPGKPPTNDDSTPVGNGNGRAPTVVPPSDES
jgi:hypothetical protein